MIPSHTTKKTASSHACNSVFDAYRKVAIAVVTLLCTIVAHCRRIFDGANPLHKTHILASAILPINVAVHCESNFCYKIILHFYTGKIVGRVRDGLHGRASWI